MDTDTIETIQNRLKSCLIDLGIKKEAITLNSRHSKFSIQEIITIKNEAYSFSLTLNGRLLSDAFEDVRKPDWKWIIKFIFHIENPHDISMTVELKTLKQKIMSWFFKQPLETYNVAFDNMFSIESNPIYAYATVLDPPVQAKLLQNILYFGKFNLLKNELHYKQNMKHILSPDNLNRIQDLIRIGAMITSNIQLWEPHKKI